MATFTLRAALSNFPTLAAEPLEIGGSENALPPSLPATPVGIEDPLRLEPQSSRQQTRWPVLYDEETADFPYFSMDFDSTYSSIQRPVMVFTVLF